jgi:GTP-binding protein LepA
VSLTWIITTVPNVSYLAYTKKDPEPFIINNPSDLPEPSKLDRVEEPFIKKLLYKADFVGNVMSLCIEKRGLSQINLFDYRTCRVKF